MLQWRSQATADPSAANNFGVTGPSVFLWCKRILWIRIIFGAWKGGKHLKSASLGHSSAHCNCHCCIGGMWRSEGQHIVFWRRIVFGMKRGSAIVSAFLSLSRLLRFWDLNSRHSASEIAGWVQAKAVLLLVSRGSDLFARDRLRPQSWLAWAWSSGTDGGWWGDGDTWQM